MDENFFRISDRLDALAVETYDSREKIAVHEAVCSSRYEQINVNMQRLDRRIGWTMYLVALSAMIQLTHGTIQDWLLAVARSVLR